MTWKNGSTYSAATVAAGGEPQQTDGNAAALRRAPLDEAMEHTAVSVIDKLKARSMKIIRKSRSKKKKITVRRTSEAVEKGRTKSHATERVVHFDVPLDEEELSNYVRQHPFRRSSKFRQPLRRVSRAKGSPPPAYLARIRPIPEDPLERCFAQPNFDQTSDGEEEEEEEKLPPILLQSLQNGTAASGGESSGDETGDSSDEEGYTVLPAVTACADKIDEEEERRHGIASNPIASEATRRASTTYIRRRSSYRASVRRESVRRASVRRGSLRRPSTFTRARRCSIVAGTVRRRSSAVPGYVYRRRSVGASSPYASNPLKQRKKRRRTRRRYRRPRKIVVIGDMCSGKSSLISAYCRDQFSDVYVPTILTSCMTDADVLGEKIELVVVEVAGRTDYSKFRHCAYKKMDLVILCYSADNPKSLSAIKDHWVPELTTFAPTVPYILVGTKKDIREEHIYEIELSKQSKINVANNASSTCTTNAHADDFRDKFVTTRQGLETAELIGAQDFIECSAMYRDSTRDVFETAAKVALRRSPRRKKKHTQRADTCTIL